MTFHIHREMVYQYLLAGGGLTELYKVRGGLFSLLVFLCLFSCFCGQGSAKRKEQRERSREGMTVWCHRGGFEHGSLPGVWPR